VMLGEALILHIVESTTFHLFRHGYLHLRFVNCALIHPSQDMRVAFSAILLIRDGGNYLLVRNLHRPESFGPFGGVFKYIDPSRLDQLEFKPETTASGKDMKDDLRGYLPRKKLSALVAWFKTMKGRELADECIRRELAEEIAEVGLSSQLKCPDIFPIRLIRSVQESPARVPGQNYTQFRLFEIYEPDLSKKSIKHFCNRLLGHARRGHKDLLLVSAEEIVSGRAASGPLIGHHAGYLFGKKRVRPDTPMFNKADS
jgi:hypothetical protein